jgi:hypothetical protein
MMYASVVVYYVIPRIMSKSRKPTKKKNTREQYSPAVSITTIMENVRASQERKGSVRHAAYLLQQGGQGERTKFQQLCRNEQRNWRHEQQR